VIVFDEEARADLGRKFELNFSRDPATALYQHAPLEGIVRIAAVRHQREGGYPEG